MSQARTVHVEYRVSHDGGVSLAIGLRLGGGSDRDDEVLHTTSLAESEALERELGKANRVVRRMLRAQAGRGRSDGR